MIVIQYEFGLQEAHMSKRIGVKVKPLGRLTSMDKRDFDLEKTEDRYRGCYAYVFRESVNWDDTSLEIRWNSDMKVFTVIFKGVGRNDLNMEKALSKDIPLKIARSSRCECGGVLELGDYSIRSTRDDFTFEGVYFCPKCKSKFLAERAGIRHLISKWIKGLKKIEIKAGGVGIERE
jgi:hypothetical protein